MADQLCRVTVVGERRRVDLAVPARAPIAEYIATVAGLCEQDDDASFPAVWSLAAAGRGPFPLQASLDQAGVLDGQVLYLRDVAAGEADEPVVLDIAEAVEEASGELGRWAWSAHSRSVTLLAVGACWLVAAFIVLALRPDGLSPRLLSGLATGAGLGSAAVAAIVTRQRRAVPAAAGLALALSVVAELAIGGGFLPGHPTPAAVAGGAAAGCFLAYFAVRDLLTLPLPVLAVITLALTIILSVARAGAVQSAAVIAIAGLALLAIGPQWAGQAVAYRRLAGDLAGGDADVQDQVRRAWLLLAVWSTLAGLLTGADLVLLTTFPDWYGQALAGCAGLVLVLGAGAYRQLTQVIPVAVAGAAGLLALLLELPARGHQPPWAGPLAATVAGLAILIATFPRTGAGAPPSGPGGFTRAATLVLRAVCVALMIGSFGVFSELLSLGHRL